MYICQKVHVVHQHYHYHIISDRAVDSTLSKRSEGSQPAISTRADTTNVHNISELDRIDSFRNKKGISVVSNSQNDLSHPLFSCLHSQRKRRSSLFPNVKSQQNITSQYSPSMPPNVQFTHRSLNSGRIVSMNGLNPKTININSNNFIIPEDTNSEKELSNRSRVKFIHMTIPSKLRDLEKTQSVQPNNFLSVPLSFTRKKKLDDATSIVSRNNETEYSKSNIRVEESFVLYNPNQLIQIGSKLDSEHSCTYLAVSNVLPKIMVTVKRYSVFHQALASEEINIERKLQEVQGTFSPYILKMYHKYEQDSYIFILKEPFEHMITDENDYNQLICQAKLMFCSMGEAGFILKEEAAIAIEDFVFCHGIYKFNALEKLRQGHYCRESTLERIRYLEREVSKRIQGSKGK